MANTCRRCKHDFNVEDHKDLDRVGVTRLCPKCLDEAPPATADEGAPGGAVPAAAPPRRR
jgi:hypothetical protein